MPAELMTIDQIRSHKGDLNVEGRTMQFVGVEESESFFGPAGKQWYLVFNPGENDSQRKRLVPAVKDKEHLYSVTADITDVCCEYCRQMLKKGESTTGRIFKNRTTVSMKFCKDSGCAGYYQMGCEG